MATANRKSRAQKTATVSTDAHAQRVQAWRLAFANLNEEKGKIEGGFAAHALECREVFETVDELTETVKALGEALGWNPNTAKIRASEYAAVYKAPTAPVGNNLRELVANARELIREQKRANGEEVKERAPRQPKAEVEKAGPVVSMSPLAMLQAAINELKKDVKGKAALAILAELTDMAADLTAIIGSK